MSDTIITNDALQVLVLQLKNTLAWRSRAGSGAGSIFTLEFGPALSGNNSQGEFSLMVYCAWRIVRANQIICSWHDNSDAVLAPALATLEGQEVAEVKLSEWCDLTLRFGNGHELHILNDFSPNYHFEDSWFITHQGNTHYSVGADNSITCESPV